jgi:hypothetical protein
MLSKIMLAETTSINISKHLDANSLHVTKMAKKLDEYII